MIVQTASLAHCTNSALVVRVDDDPHALEIPSIKYVSDGFNSNSFEPADVPARDLPALPELEGHPTAVDDNANAPGRAGVNMDTQG